MVIKFGCKGGASEKAFRSLDLNTRHSQAFPEIHFFNIKSCNIHCQLFHDSRLHFSNNWWLSNLIIWRRFDLYLHRPSSYVITCTMKLKTNIFALRTIWLCLVANITSYFSLNTIKKVLWMLIFKAFKRIIFHWKLMNHETYIYIYIYILLEKKLWNLNT